MTNKRPIISRLFNLRSFLAIVLLGLLLLRLETTPSFEGSEQRNLRTYIPDYVEANDPRSVLSFRDETGAFGLIQPVDWKRWVAKADEEPENTVISISKLEDASVQTEWGCGVSIQLLFQTRTLSEPVPTLTKAFFKAAYSDMHHYDAESHLREIKAYYLDRILQTNVVLPSIGYRLDRRRITSDDHEWRHIEEGVGCLRLKDIHKDAFRASKDTVDGSLMLWMYDLSNVERDWIVDTVTRKKDRKTREERESAMNYAIFHYLGACMKSEHNHFAYPKQFQKGGNYIRQFVAIDNDRCLTPKGIFSDVNVVPELHRDRINLWENLVYDKICEETHPGSPVLKVVKEAAAAYGQNVTAQSALLSNRLLIALETDALVYELAKSQPEAIFEIDDRVNRLAKHVRKHCPELLESDTTPIQQSNN